MSEAAPSSESNPLAGSRILVVDDEFPNRKLLEKRLNAAGYEIILAEDGDQALEAMRVTPAPDLVLLDLMMPNRSGFDVLEIRNGEPALKEIPVVVLSALSDEANKVRGLELGASDYLVKPFSNQELLARVRNLLTVVMQRRELLEAYKQLDELAATDPLTGVANRRSYDHFIKEESARAHRHGYSLSLAMFDIDHFKQINDTFGHQVGDSVLRQVAKLLSTGLRSGDRVARYGGEEFAIILPFANAGNAAMVADKLRTAVEECFIPELNRNCTVSGGVAGWPETPLQDLFTAADKALYEAKHNGRNRICQAPSNPDPATQIPS